MKNFKEQFNIFKKKLAKSLSVDETSCGIIDSFIVNHEEEYNKLLENIWKEDYEDVKLDLYRLELERNINNG